MGNIPSTAAQIMITIIPIVGIVMGCAVLILYLVLNHRQKILMIEKGVFHKRVLDIDSLSLFSGLILDGVGIALTLFFWLKEGVGYSLLSGLIPLAVGLSLTVFFIMRRKMPNNAEK